MNREDPGPTPFARGDVYAMTSAEAVAFDARAIDRLGVPQRVLMENAGRAVATVVDALYPGSPVVGVLGSGNNGGDGVVALRTLAAWGHPVRALLAADREESEPLLHGFDLTYLDGPASPPGAEWSGRAEPVVILDAILGTGIRGAPRARQAEAIEWINRSDCPVIAVDVPSGVDSTTGETPGVVVTADVTVALGAPRVGALLHPGRAHAGRHLSVEMGFPPLAAGDADAVLATPAWALARMPTRSTDTHKNAVGRLLVVGGQEGMAGAVILAATAAFRSGSGLVRVATAAANRDAVHAALPEAIVLDFADDDALADAIGTSDAVVVGPGLGRTDASATALRRVSAASCPLLLDADALNLAAEGVIDVAKVASDRLVLLTPHPGEMARLAPDGSGSPLDVATAAATRFGATVLLKGAPSVVRTPGLPAVIDTQSSSDLAVAGMGDTLSGVCGTLLAQGLHPREAASVGIYLSGRAARIADRGRGLVPSDVAVALPAAMAEAAPKASSMGLPFVTFEAAAAR